MENIFSSTGVVHGESMIGYTRYLEKLREYAFCQNKSIGVSVSGMHQVGKTSLIHAICTEAQKDDYLTIYIDLCEIKADSNMLMFELIQSVTRLIKRELNLRYINEDLINEDIKEIQDCGCDNNSLRSSFKYLFEDIGRMYHIIFVIDEFDSAKVLENADNELLRTIMTTAKYNTSLFLISRSQIEFIVADNHNNSKLAASIKKEYIKGFNKDDINQYYSKLSEYYSIDLNEEERKTLEFHAGIIPKLYSQIGEKLVSAKSSMGATNIDNACKGLANEFFGYYSTVFDRLDNDGYVNDVYAAVIGPITGVSAQRIDALKAIGYLMRDDENNYIAFSLYFSVFLRNQKIKFSSEWEKIIAVEKKIKNIVEEQLLRFNIKPSDKEYYEKFLNKAYRQAGKVYNSLQYDKYMDASEKNFHCQCTLLDVMSLKNTIHAFLSPLWNDCFSQYFNNDPYRNWELHFEQCCKARDPLAHGHKEFLTQAERDIVSGYCDNIQNAIINSAGNINKTPMVLPEWFDDKTDATGTELRIKEKETIIESSDLEKCIGNTYTFKVSTVKGSKVVQGVLAENNFNATLKREFYSSLDEDKKVEDAVFQVVVREVAPQKDRLLVEMV